MTLCSLASSSSDVPSASEPLMGDIFLYISSRRNIFYNSTKVGQHTALLSFWPIKIIAIQKSGKLLCLMIFGIALCVYGWSEMCLLSTNAIY